MYRVDIPSRMKTLHEFRQQGGCIAAVLPIHYSRALLRAFNFLPMEVWGPPMVSGGFGEAHLQPYVCSIVRNALSFIKSGSLQATDLILVPHACDSLQGLGSLLLDFVPQQQPVLTQYIPRGKRESDLDFLAGEFRTIFQRLESITGKSPSSAELMACIHREEQADGLLAKLHQQRRGVPLEDESFYRLVRSREYLPAEKFTQLAQQTLAQPGELEHKGIPLILSGIVPEPMTLFTTLSEMGAHVVADDFACCGRRLYPAGTNNDPFRRIAEQIIHAPPDSTHGSTISERLDHLLKLVKDFAARAVIFYEVKFCEPELFDLPQLHQGLRDHGVPSLTVEIDLNDGLAQPIENRLAAFLEMLQ